MTIRIDQLRRWGTLLGAVAFMCMPITGRSQAPAPSWQQLNSQAEEAYKSRPIGDAVAASRRALAAAKTDDERATSLTQLGSFLGANGLVTEAEPLLLQALTIRETTPGSDSVEYSDSAHNLAVLYRDTGRFADARQLAARALAIRRRLPPTDDRLLQAMDTHASIQARSGEYEGSLPLFEEAMALHEAIPPARRSMELYGVLGANLGATYHRLGRYQAAETTLLKARPALTIGLGTEHLAYIISSITLAALKADQAQYAEAEGLFNEVIGVLAKPADSSPTYLTALNNRGVMFRQVRNFDAAERDLTLSLNLRSKAAPNAVATAVTRSNLAQLIHRRNRPAGEQMLRDAVTVLTAPAAPPFEHVSVLIALANMERDRGALADATATLQKAIAAAEPLGQIHPLRATVMREIGRTRLAAGDLSGAEEALTDSLRLAEAVHGSAHPDLLLALYAFARVRAARGDATQALSTYRRAFEIEDRFLNDVFAIGTESFKETVLESLVDPVHELIGFQSRHADALPDARVLAFEATTRRKGRVLEQVRRRRESLRNAGGATEPQRDRHRLFRACRTALMLARSDRTKLPGLGGACGLQSTELAGRYERLLFELRGRWTPDLSAEAARAIAVLEEREQALEVEIVRTAGAAGYLPALLTKEALTAKLRADELLIEFIAYNDVDQAPAPGLGTKKYGAFVLNQSGRLQWVSLGEAGPIDGAIGDLLQAANDWAVARYTRASTLEMESERTAIRALAALSKSVWTPLDPLISSSTAVRPLRIAPDSSLNLVPFEALGLVRGGVVLDRFSVGYLPAGRDLLRSDARVTPGPPVVVLSTGKSPRFPPIPDGEAEGRELVAALRGQLRTGADASEQAVKLLRSPQVLHLIGHGLVNQDSCIGMLCPAGASQATLSMARSYLVLEESYARVSGSAEDGYLTAIELQNVDLSGTEMLVLAHCQMASGQPSAGEGVYGMRRAAAVAGARTFVAPLWNVSDKDQRTVMRGFYEGVVRGQDRATALRNAKIAVRRTPATRSFLYWAPVILSGDIAPLRLPAGR